MKKEVIVDLACGMAVLRGADVFVLGIMGAPSCKDFIRAKQHFIIVFLAFSCFFLYMETCGTHVYICSKSVCL